MTPDPCDCGARALYSGQCGPCYRRDHPPAERVSVVAVVAPVPVTLPAPKPRPVASIKPAPVPKPVRAPLPPQPRPKRVVVCLRCQRERTHKARGLCSPCHRRACLNGTIDTIGLPPIADRHRLAGIRSGEARRAAATPEIP